MVPAQDVPAPQSPASATPAASYPYAAPPNAGAYRPERPLGVTLIGVLYAVFSAFFLLGGIFLIAGGGILAGVLLNLIPGLGGQFGALGGVLLAMIGVFLAVIGALVLLVTIGFFKGRPWAWTTVLILEAISAVTNLFGVVEGDFGAILAVALPLLIIWYLFEPTPKAYFGKAHVRAFWQKGDAPAQ